MNRRKIVPPPPPPLPLDETPVLQPLRVNSGHLAFYWFHLPGVVAVVKTEEIPIGALNKPTNKRLS